MKTRAQAIEERRKKAEADAKKGEAPSAPGAALTLKCPACKETVTISANAPRNNDGNVECPECGCALDPKKAAAEPEPIPEPETKHAKSEERSRQGGGPTGPARLEGAAVLEPPPAYCNMCGAAWPRVDGRPFPNCGHTDGFVYDRSEAKELKPPAGHPQPTAEERAAWNEKHGIGNSIPIGGELSPGTRVTGYGGGGTAPFNPKRPPEQPVPPPALVRVGNMLFAAWGKMTFKVADYGQNISVGPFEISCEIAPGADVIIEGARLTQQMRQLADTAFHEQLAWYLTKVGIIEKKLGR